MGIQQKKRRGGNTSEKDKKMNKTLPLKGQRESGDWPIYYNHRRRMVPKDEYNLLPFQMKLLHDKVRKLTGKRGGQTTHFIAKVPANYQFLTDYSSGKFIVDIRDIWHIFNQSSLAPSVVRLWALYLTKENRRLNNWICAVADPFPMNQDNAYCVTGRSIIIEYLVTVMLDHKETPYLIVPYRTR